MKKLCAIVAAASLVVACTRIPENAVRTDKPGMNLAWENTEPFYPTPIAEYDKNKDTTETRELIGNADCEVTIEAIGAPMYKFTVPAWRGGRESLPYLSEMLIDKVFRLDRGIAPGGTGMPSIIVDPVYRNKQIKITYRLDPLSQIPETSKDDNVFIFTMDPKDVEVLTKDVLEGYAERTGKMG
jgi:hypothetical protein